LVLVIGDKGGISAIGELKTFPAAVVAVSAASDIGPAITIYLLLAGLCIVALLGNQKIKRHEEIPKQNDPVIMGFLLSSGLSLNLRILVTNSWFTRNWYQRNVC